MLAAGAGAGRAEQPRAPPSLHVGAGALAARAGEGVCRAGAGGAGRGRLSRVAAQVLPALVTAHPPETHSALRKKAALPDTLKSSSSLAAP